MTYHPDVDWKMDPVLEIWIDEGRSDGVVLELEGSLDRSSAPSLSALVRDLADAGHRRITVDLARVTPAEDAVVEVLTATQSYLRDLGGSVTWRFSNPAPAVRPVSSLETAGGARLPLPAPGCRTRWRPSRGDALPSAGRVVPAS